MGLSPCSAPVFGKQGSQRIQQIMREHPGFPVQGSGTVGSRTMEINGTGSGLKGRQAAGQQALVMPASTSPLPPRESPGLPVGLTAQRPSGPAMTVCAPFSTTTAFHAFA